MSTQPRCGAVSASKAVPCFQPADAWPACPPAKGVVFDHRKSYAGALPIKLPCRQCLGCRLDHSQTWATRIVHEAKFHACTSFLTLTYAVEHLPDDNGVHKRHMQLFLKRLRFDIRPRKIRFFACGEYGEGGGRPHYHVVLFGFDFADDRYIWRKLPSGFLSYRSPRLERLWPYGHCEIGTVSVQSAGYIARYALKKVGGRAAAHHYDRPHELTGEFHRVHPEFILMSTKPGLGRQWFDKWKMDVFPSDFVMIDGQKRKIPSYYDKLLREAEKEALKHVRKSQGRKHAANNTPERLAVRAESQALRAKRLTRKFEQ